MPRDLLHRALLASALACLPVTAQTQGFRAGPVYSDGFPKISVVLDVGHSRTGGSREVKSSEIALAEDGVGAAKPVQLEPFKQTGRGMAIVICVDVSGSMRGEPLDTVRRAVEGFASELTAADRVALLTFADDERVDVPFNSPPEALKAAIAGLTARGSVTQLYRAIFKAHGLFQETPGLPLRRRILVISDGRDEGSKYTFDDILRVEKEHPVPIDTIALAPPKPDRRSTEDLSALERLSDTTGGNYNAVYGPDQLRQTAVNGIQWLQASPVATFELQRIKADGARHTIGVRWTQYGGVREASLQTPLEQSTEPWMFAAAAGGALVLLLLLVLLFRRRAPQPLAAPASTPAQRPPTVAQPEPKPIQRPSSKTTPEPGLRDPKPQPAIVPPVNPQPAEQKPQPVKQRRATQFRAAFNPPSEGNPTAYLFVESGPLQGSRFPIDQASFWIGAGDNNHLQVDDPAVSWNHVCIQFENSDLFLWDQSTNGSLVNGEAVKNERRRLSLGDRITIGRAVFQVVSG